MALNASMAVITGGFLDIAALKLLYPMAKGHVGEWRVRSALTGMGAAQLHDVILPDDRGLTQIDHLVLTPAGIIVLETKNYAGRIFTYGRRKNWVQHIGRHINKLHNPQDQNYRHRKAVEYLAPGVPVQDWVLMIGDARFPNGKPDGVLTLWELKQALRRLDAGEVPPQIMQAWLAITTSAKTDGQARKAHLRSIPGGQFGMRRSLAGKALLFLGTALLLAGFAS
ncbi:NERD domain-containing protein [Acidithiobacillus ferriphilus]|uniref:nuclease-related domain-containing protein n=1 Tax=Acidithiobacillus ferriphilus TaxID=1689834 RepID=UPI001C062522|nr:nuclease-related domain-containing protein [Acidithiobacillus ferriphilus]MBU2786488.1 NERD domain-containing protein [Acidithiobacillus ferriphilus]MEB8474545.1 nuclease-related domain-containing protein [Acidithiobacillus ferriphilus]